MCPAIGESGGDGMYRRSKRPVAVMSAAGREDLRIRLGRRFELQTIYLHRVTENYFENELKILLLLLLFVYVTTSGIVRWFSAL